MNSALLSIKNLQVTVEGKVVLKGVDFEIGAGKLAILMGVNGSGKSSLANVLLGNKEYRISNIEETKITFDGKDLVAMSSDERARAGLFLAWQNPIMIPGVSVFNLCKTSYETLRQAQGKALEYEKLTEFKTKLEKIAERVGLSKEHIGRSVNEGFSGGEKKRLELLQLILLKPKLAILDEIDSGLDAKGVEIVLEVIREMKREGTSFILITHNKQLLGQVEVDLTWEITNGRLSTGV